MPFGLGDLISGGTALYSMFKGREKSRDLSSQLRDLSEERGKRYEEGIPRFTAMAEAAMRQDRANLITSLIKNAARQSRRGGAPIRLNPEELGKFVQTAGGKGFALGEQMAGKYAGLLNPAVAQQGLQQGFTGDVNLYGALGTMVENMVGGRSPGANVPGGGSPRQTNPYYEELLKRLFQTSVDT